jgi:hypothetical protein
MDLWIWDKNVIINFIDNVKPDNVVVINWTTYNSIYKIDNITTFKTPLSVYSSDFYCSYKYVVNLWTSFQYKNFTIRTWLDWENCWLQIEKLPQQTASDYKIYSNDVMSHITITEVKQIQKPYNEIRISENYLFYIISWFLVALLFSVVFFVNKYYKNGDFIRK